MTDVAGEDDDLDDYLPPSDDELTRLHYDADRSEVSEPLTADEFVSYGAPWWVVHGEEIDATALSNRKRRRESNRSRGLPAGYERFWGHVDIDPRFGGAYGARRRIRTCLKGFRAAAIERATAARHNARLLTAEHPRSNGSSKSIDSLQATMRCSQVRRHLDTSTGANILSIVRVKESAALPFGEQSVVVPASLASVRVRPRWSARRTSLLVRARRGKVVGIRVGPSP